MHQMLANVDSSTFQRILEDAKSKGLELEEWTNRAIIAFLHESNPLLKEIYITKNSDEMHENAFVHSEMVPHKINTVSDETELLKKKISNLEEERDQLQAQLACNQNVSQGISIREAEILHLSIEIEKNLVELDSMETAVERLRIEHDRLLPGDEGTSRRRYLERELEQKEYEVGNFSETIEMLMGRRDALRRSIGETK